MYSHGTMPSVMVPYALTMFPDGSLNRCPGVGVKFFMLAPHCLDAHFPLSMLLAEIQRNHMHPLALLVRYVQRSLNRARTCLAGIRGSLGSLASSPVGLWLMVAGCLSGLMSLRLQREPIAQGICP